MAVVTCTVGAVFPFQYKLSSQAIDAAADRQQVSLDLWLAWEAHPTPGLQPHTLVLGWQKDTDNELSVSQPCVMPAWSTPCASPGVSKAGKEQLEARRQAPFHRHLTNLMMCLQHYVCWGRNLPLQAAAFACQQGSPQGKQPQPRGFVQQGSQQPQLPWEYLGYEAGREVRCEVGVGETDLVCTQGLIASSGAAGAKERRRPAQGVLHTWQQLYQCARDSQ